MPSSSDEPEYADAVYVGRLLDFTPRIVARMAARGDLRGATKVGKTWRFHMPTLRYALAKAQVVRPARGAEPRRDQGPTFREQCEAAGRLWEWVEIEGARRGLSEKAKTRLFLEMGEQERESCKPRRGRARKE